MIRGIALLLAAALCTAAHPAAAQCCGDCDGNGIVSIDELVQAVSISLSGCPSPPTPGIVLSNVRLSTFSAALAADMPQGRVALTIDTTWSGDDGTNRVLFSVSKGSTAAGIALTKNGPFLRWILTQPSGFERDLSVNIASWDPGTHTIKASWGPDSTSVEADGSGQFSEETPNNLVLPSGSTVVLGAMPAVPSAGTTFRYVFFQ